MSKIAVEFKNVKIGQTFYKVFDDKPFVKATKYKGRRGNNFYGFSPYENVRVEVK